MNDNQKKEFHQETQKGADSRSEEVKATEKIKGRYRSIEGVREKFFSEKITTPQDLEEIKKKGQIGIIKIANESLVYKLLERCRTYREKIAKLTKSNEDKDETIDLLVARLSHYEPDLFKNIQSSQKSEQVDNNDKKTCECEEAECKKGEICQELEKEEKPKN